MPVNNYIIKQASQKELGIAIDWATQEGWNPGLNDAHCYYQADANGFFIGWLGHQPIATLSAVKYNNCYGFFGFYIVKPEFRGQGYGLQIWNAGLNYLAGCSAGLDGVVERQHNYQQSGFKFAYRNIRFQSVGGGEYPLDSSIVDLATIAFAVVDDYDSAFFPTQRSAFINSWIQQPECTALGISRNDQLQAYGLMRKCVSGYKIGPLFADSPEDAEALFLALRAHAQASDPIYLDVPEINPAAMALVQRYKMDEVFATARMYRGSIPVLPTHRIYGVTSFELG